MPLPRIDFGTIELPDRQLKIEGHSAGTLCNVELPDRQLKISHIVVVSDDIGELPSRQLKLGQEVNNHIL